MDGVNDYTDIEENLIDSANYALDSTIKSIIWNQVRQATASDENMNQLLSIIDLGIPKHRHELPPSLREYHQFREHIYSVDGVIIYKDRIIIPPCLREQILSALHAAHQGISSMISRAEASVFWPGITADITAVRANCNHCHQIAPSQPSAPPYNPIPPKYPFQCICADIFMFKGTHYLVIVDRYANWPIVEYASGGSKGLKTSLRRAFSTYGIPEELASDGGPEFTSSEIHANSLKIGVYITVYHL
ncbi:uncharacterized protein K02A2.6-like [Lingula anatina]|uniref:Uncharacterized protein K02A2.6-like n=1 Tax=Lingula anatina TaxID=7574 RepID=A0A1S3IRW7_LINAN|nr:uncharacterized protein K02A2.6-like [Lingula anatina]XP_013400277.1 uncharacterized protein K02A2.6-like [Lingula anatina]|eukprot:XP_013400274.1 uncharacterized protein K02A2.6-like [Lingula anatina]